MRWISLVVSIWEVHHPCESPDSKGSIEVHAKRETWDGNINVEAGIGREITIIMERRLQALLFLHSKLRTLGLFSGKNSNGRCPGMWLLASPYMHTVAYILAWDVRYYVFVFRGAYHIGVGFALLILLNRQVRRPGVWDKQLYGSHASFVFVVTILSSSCRRSQETSVIIGQLQKSVANYTTVDEDKIRRKDTEENIKS